MPENWLRFWHSKMARTEIVKAWEDQFTKLFTLVGLKDTSKIVVRMVHARVVEPNEKDYFVGEAAAEDVSGMAD
jgi:hypothetical protein